MGSRVAEVVGKRLGRTILELGGNNGLIVAPQRRPRAGPPRHAFAAVGTAGQRCTTLRRLFVHESVHDAFLEHLVAPTAASRSATRGMKACSWAR